MAITIIRSGQMRNSDVITVHAHAFSAHCMQHIIITNCFYCTDIKIGFSAHSDSSEAVFAGSPTIATTATPMRRHASLSWSSINPVHFWQIECIAPATWLVILDIEFFPGILSIETVSLRRHFVIRYFKSFDFFTYDSWHFVSYGQFLFRRQFIQSTL